MSASLFALSLNFKGLPRKGRPCHRFMMRNMRIDRRRISVFIDASNLHHCQKKNGWNIDYEKLKKYLSRRGEVVGLYYFTPSPHYEEKRQIENYRKFKVALISFGYTVIDKEIKIIRTRDKQTGEIVKERKGNLDGEIVLYMLTTYDQYDEIVFIGGDSDFEKILDYMVKNKKLVTCISNSRTTAQEIKNIAHEFIPLNTIRDYIEKKPRFHGA